MQVTEIKDREGSIRSCRDQRPAKYFCEKVFRVDLPDVMYKFCKWYLHSKCEASANRNEIWICGSTSLLSFFSSECCCLILQVLHITLLSFSYQIIGILLGLTPRLVEDMEEGIFKRCACLAQKLIILRKNRPSKSVFAVGVFAVLDRLQKVNWCIIVFVARIIDYDWPRDEGYSAAGR